MSRFMLPMVLVGAALLAVVLHRTDLSEVWHRLVGLGWGGFAVVLLANLACLVCASASWLCTLHGVRPGPRWLYRLGKLSLVGHAFAMTTPLAGLGGEPVKAILAKRHYGVSYRDMTASIILTRTTDLTAQLLFVTIGLLLMLFGSTTFGASGYRTAAVAGLVTIALGTGLLFLMQRPRVMQRIGGWLARSRIGRWIPEPRVQRALEVLREVEGRVALFYALEPGRFGWSVGFAFADWMIAAWVVQIGLGLLGTPVSFVDALVIEAFVALVRSALFMIPGDLGTQEAALVLASGAVTGSPAAGLALAAVRRGIGVLLIVWGLALALRYSLRPGDAARMRAAAVPSA